MLVAEFEPFSTEVLKGVADAIHGSGFELVAYGEAKPALVAHWLGLIVLA